MLNCGATNLEIVKELKCNGDIILYIAVGVTGTLLLVVAALLLTICCLARKCRRLDSLRFCAH